MKRPYACFALLAGALSLTAAAVAGCSSSAQGPQPVGSGPSTTAPVPGTTASAGSNIARSTTGPTSTTGANSPQAQAALAAYEGMVNDWVSAARTANYQDPALGQYASGSALEELTKALLAEQQKHAVSEGDPVVTNVTYDEMVPAGNPTQIMINSCFSDTSWLEYKASDGSLYNNVPGGQHKTQVLAMDEDGTWKIDQLEIGGVGTC